MNEKYLEVIAEISSGLLAYSIPFYYQSIYDGVQFRFPWAGDADAAIHSGTYGNLNNKIETFQFPWDLDDVSVLSTDEFLYNITNLWEKQREFYSFWEPYKKIPTEKEI